VGTLPKTRPDPDALLRQVEAEEEFHKRGRLKIFLGYISGVGKSFRMLDEARRRREHGEDLVVGAIQPVNFPQVEGILKNMEVIPVRKIDGRPAMDVDAILRRRPQICLIDGLAYDNPPGSANAKRWQDAEQLLVAGISVIGSVNLQYIEEYRPRVETITGKKVTETLPLSFVNLADEIEIVDAPAELTLERERAKGAGGDESGKLTPQKLSELREIALLLAADVVDRQLERYLKRKGIEPVSGAQERILVCVKPGVNAQKMIESGRRNADRFHGELFVVYISSDGLPPEDQQALEANLELAQRLNARTEHISAEDVVHAIMDFARAHGITQIFVGHSTHESWWHRLWGGSLDRLIRVAEGIDVRVFPH
jgi:two-component system sensor histidine kinase KdpD